MTNDEYIKELQTKVVQQSKEISRLNEKYTKLKQENYEYANVIGTMQETIGCFYDLKQLIKDLNERLKRL